MIISVKTFKLKNLISALLLLIFDNKTGRRNDRIGSEVDISILAFELIDSAISKSAFKNSSAP